MMKKMLIPAMAIAVVVLMSVWVTAAEKLVLKVGHDANTTYPHHIAAEKFKEVLEAETKGAVEVQIFPDGQLGNEPQMIEGIRLGTIDAAFLATGNMAAFVPEVDLFNLPYIFRDLPHAYRVVDGPVGQRVAKAVEAKTGSVFLGWWFAGLRTMWNAKRPIMTPADLKGLKIRVMASPIMVDTFSAFGGQATPLPFVELYNALQQGVVDGGDTDVVDLVVEKFYEVTKHVSLTHHFIVAGTFIASKKRYDRLPPEIQKAVVKAGQAAIPVHRRTQEAMAEAAVKQLKEKGLQFYTVDQKPFKDAAQKVYVKYADKVGGMALIEEVGKQ